MKIPELQPPPQGSSSIYRRGYDGSSLFSVQYKPDRKVYRYEAVAPDVAQAVMGADSIGKAVASLIKGKFDYHTVEPSELEEGTGS